MGARTGAHPVEHVRPASAEVVAQLSDSVALVTLGPDAPGAREMCTALVDRGIAVSLGHSAAEIEAARSLVDVGASMITHIGNATGPMSARDPGVFGLGLDDERIAVSVIADLVHLHPAVLRVVAQAARDRLVLVTDAVAWRSESHRRRGVEMTDGAPRLSDGTLAGSALTMDAAVRNVVHVGALDLGAALVAASARPAEVLGLDDRGVLRPGTLADLVALDESGRVLEVWIEGESVGLVPS